MPEITVTSGDIANGRPWPSGNPVARAARRAFPDAWWVTAGLRSLEVIDQDGMREHPLPDEAARFLAAWYETWKAQPIRFTLPDSEQAGAAA